MQVVPQQLSSSAQQLLSQVTKSHVQAVPSPEQLALAGQPGGHCPLQPSEPQTMPSQSGTQTHC
jgi:hypothetical protein